MRERCSVPRAGTDPSASLSTIRSTADGARRPVSSARGVELASHIERQLNRALASAPLASPIDDQVRRVFRLLTAESLATSIRPRYDGLSRINADGLPFQWCLVAGAPPGVRFVCEVGEPGTSAARRADLSLERLSEACDVLGYPTPAWFEELCRSILLPAAEEWPRHWRSALWIGVAAGPRGAVLKPYINLNRGAAIDRWRRIGWVLKSLQREEALETLCRLSGPVSRDSWPVGLAVDIAEHGEPGRVKAYFRSGAVDELWLHRWYSSLGASAAAASLRKLLDVFPRRAAALPARSVAISLELHQNGNATLKTDAAVGSWTPKSWPLLSGVDQLIRGLGLRGEISTPLSALDQSDRHDLVPVCRCRLRARRIAACQSLPRTFGRCRGQVREPQPWKAAAHALRGGAPCL